jgi:hypothetical protein
MAQIKSLGISTAMICIIFILLVISMNNSFYTKNNVSHCLLASDKCSGCFGECDHNQKNCTDVSEKCKALQGLISMSIILTFTMFCVSLSCDLDLHNNFVGVIMSYVSIGSLALINLFFLIVFILILTFTETNHNNGLLTTKAPEALQQEMSEDKDSGFYTMICAIVLLLIVAVMGIGSHQHL